MDLSVVVRLSGGVAGWAATRDVLLTSRSVEMLIVS